MKWPLPQIHHTWARFAQNPPSKDGERLACIIRLIVCAIFIGYVAFFHFSSLQTNIFKWFPLLGTVSIWGALNIYLLLSMMNDSYRPWFSMISVLIDIFVVAAINIMITVVYPLNYSGNHIFSLYFLTIGLAVIRKNYWLVLAAGILSALCYLGISLYFCLILNFNSNDFVYFNHEMVTSIALLNQIAKSVSLGIAGLIVAYMTKQIRVAEKKYHTLFDNIPDGIVLTNQAGMVETTNDSFAQMVATPLAKIVGKPVNSLFVAAYAKNVDNAVMTQRTSSTEIPVMITESSMWPRKENTQKILSVRNITAQEELKEQISQAQKTEVLGQIARGLAHDFNNLLGGMLGAASLIKSRLGKLPPSQNRDKLLSHSHVIQDCAENASDILKQLLALSRTNSRPGAALNIEKLLLDLREFTQKTFGETYQVRLTTDFEDIAMVDGDEEMMFQAFLNICINAKESMPQGGTIQIDARTEIPGKFVHFPSIAATKRIRCARIQFTDSGFGMNTDVQHRCLEPFFSTKATEKRGTGLGLSISYNIIRHHNGYLKITSSPEQGTDLSVYLPTYEMDSQG